jgi:hypothetical protein
MIKTIIYYRNDSIYKTNWSFLVVSTLCLHVIILCVHVIIVLIVLVPPPSCNWGSRRADNGGACRHSWCLSKRLTAAKTLPGVAVWQGGINNGVSSGCTLEGGAIIYFLQLQSVRCFIRKLVSRHATAAAASFVPELT